MTHILNRSHFPFDSVWLTDKCMNSVEWMYSAWQMFVYVSCVRSIRVYGLACILKTRHLTNTNLIPFAGISVQWNYTRNSLVFVCVPVYLSWKSTAKSQNRCFINNNVILYSYIRYSIYTHSYIWYILRHNDSTLFSMRCHSITTESNGFEFLLGWFRIVNPLYWNTNNFFYF